MQKTELTLPESLVQRAKESLGQRKETPLPPSGGSWVQDPLTGELVQADKQQDN